MNPDTPKRGAGMRWILRVLAILIGVIALVDLVITLTPMPTPQRPDYSAGARVVFRSSETETSIIRAKNWAESNLNFVGWVARVKGYGPYELYMLKRNENWKMALELGQIVTMFFLFIVSLALWLISARGALKKILQS